MAAKEKFIKKLEKRADKELEERTRLQDKYAEALLDTSKGIISQGELIHEIEPLAKARGKQIKRSKNAELSLERAIRKGKSKA